MSDPAEASVVGVVGERTDTIRSAIERADVRHRCGSLSTVLASTPDVLVVAGEHALLDVAARDPTPDVPILPVAAGTGVQSVARNHVRAAISALLDGAGTTHERPILAATEAGVERARALCELMLVTAEPARISEYAIQAGDDHVAQFRADGVVVATPAGTHGYARSVGAPVLARGTNVVSAVPIAPFATDSDQWILPMDSITLRVERDEVDVELLADDRRSDTVPPDTPISVSVTDQLTIRTVPQSNTPFARADK
ncbi:MAG: ATP-NAD kinase [Halorientalis sp.]